MNDQSEWAWGLHHGSDEFQYESLADLIESCDVEAGDTVFKCLVINGERVIETAVPYTLTDNDVAASE